MQTNRIDGYFQEIDDEQVAEWLHDFLQDNFWWEVPSFMLRHPIVAFEIDKLEQQDNSRYFDLLDELSS